MIARQKDAPIAVGIVVPAYNAGAYLRETLQSIASQTHKAIECIVVDDGSSDDTFQIAREFASGDCRFRATSQPNAGVGAARNNGMTLLTTDPTYLCFMDADDIWLSNALELLVSSAQSTGCIGAHGLAEFINESGDIIEPGAFPDLGRSRSVAPRGVPRPYPPSEPTCFESVLISSTMFPPGLMIARADIYKRLGGFDNRVRPADDWDMLIRLARHGNISFVNEVILHYRRHQANAGASSVVPERCRQVRVKAFHSPDNTPEQQRSARRAYRAAQIGDLVETWHGVRSAWAHRDARGTSKAVLRLPLRIGRFIRGAPRIRKSDDFLLTPHDTPVSQVG